jgi:hypothetical protein
MEYKFANSSLESELDFQIEELIGKMVEGSATERDRYRYQELVEQRSKLMIPPRRTRSLALGHPSVQTGPVRTRR